MLCDLIYLQHAAADRARRFQDEAETRRLARAAGPRPPGWLRRRFGRGAARRGVVAGDARALPEPAGAAR